MRDLGTCLLKLSVILNRWQIINRAVICYYWYVNRMIMLNMMMLSISLSVLSYISLSHQSLLLISVSLSITLQDIIVQLFYCFLNENQFCLIILSVPVDVFLNDSFRFIISENQSEQENMDIIQLRDLSHILSYKKNFSIGKQSCSKLNSWDLFYFF